MNNDIKEILEIFKQVDLETDIGGCSNCPRKDKNKTCIGCLNNAKDKLLDYITNLQEENNYYFKKNNELSILNTSLRSDRDDYKSRNEKAIEYIKSLCYIESKNEWFAYGDDLSPKHIVNILQGEDKDE